jgi:probable F420-dependent oxidoreductase
VRFLYYFPCSRTPLVPSLVTADAFASLARAAADAGFAGVSVAEHPVPPEAWRTSPGGHDCVDPFVVLGLVAGAAPGLELVTYLTVVPYRNPFLLAKQAATLDVISGGRVRLGVGTGYQPLEFQALGVSFDDRNALFDEGIAVMKLAWSGEVLNVKGTGFTAEQVRCLPVPVSQPHPPLWIAGNSQLTMRRVVDVGQGWITLPNPAGKAGPGRTQVLETVDDLVRLKRYLDEYAERRERAEPIDIVHNLAFAPAEPGALRDHIVRLDDLGVTWVCVNGRGASPEQARDWIGEFGAEVIAPLTAGRPSR